MGISTNFVYPNCSNCFYQLICIIITDALHVAHQSPPTVYIAEEGKAIPLYCVGYNHTLDYTYLWKNSSGKEVSCASTPVVWVNKANTYKCIITTTNGTKFYSADISVLGKY